MTISQLPSDHALMDEVIDYEDTDDCGNTRLSPHSLLRGDFIKACRDPHSFASTLTLIHFEVEHIFDGSLIAQFMQDAAAGRQVVFLH